MTKNSEMIKKYIESAIIPISEVTSRKFATLILNQLIETEKQAYSFLDMIKVDEEKVNVSPKIDEMPKEKILEPINRTVDYFLDTSKKTFIEKLDHATLSEFAKFGFNVNVTKDDDLEIDFEN